MLLLKFLIGFMGGFFGGLIGFGGGIIMIPLMVYFLRVSQHRAHGNSLCAVVFTSISGAVTYRVWGRADLLSSFLLAFPAVFTSRYGVKFASSLSSKMLRRYFGLFNLFVSGMLILKSEIVLSQINPGPLVKIFSLLLLGSATGFLSGLFGVGGGSIMVPGLILLLGMSQHLAQGTSLFAMVPTTLSGAISYSRFGYVDKDLSILLAAGAAAGGLTGASFANTLPELYLRLIFSLVLAWLGIMYLRK